MRRRLGGCLSAKKRSLACGPNGDAELVERQGRFGPAAYMRITPTVSWSFNLEGSPFTHDREVDVRRTVHPAGTGHNPEEVT
ncbi:MAG: hypothetical protein ACRDOO_28180 [Actinomadura sp.]